jgi:hypothetical protein
MEESVLRDILFWIELTSIGTFVRESPSLLAYPTVLFMHTIGLGFLVGVSAVVDLRLLGFARGMPVRPLGRFFGIMWFGFWINAISGLLLLMADASTKLINPVFFVKMIFISSAVAIIWLMNRKVFRNEGFNYDAIPTNIKAMAGASLLCWVGATTAGRLMAYLGPVSGLYY